MAKQLQYRTTLPVDGLSRSKDPASVAGSYAKKVIDRLLKEDGDIATLELSIGRDPEFEGLVVEARMRTR